MAKTIVITGTLDTKGEEVRYLKTQVEARGYRVLVLDAGILGSPGFPPEITREEVALSGGMGLPEIIGMKNEERAIEIMAQGTSHILRRLYSEGRVDGLLAIGGTMGSTIGLAASEGLPLGVPKLLVSASPGAIKSGMGSLDLTIMPSIVDMWGMNPLIQEVLDRAAGAISGMVEAYRAGERRKTIGITTLGTTAFSYAWPIKESLKGRDLEVSVFVAWEGTGVLKRLMEEGRIAATLDLCLVEWLSNICLGQESPGASRFDVAIQKGIPQVIGCGGTDFFVWPGGSDTLPPKFEGRRFHQHNPLICLVQPAIEERLTLARAISAMVNRCTSPIALLIPAQGFSEFDRQDGFFYDPAGREAFISYLKNVIDPRVPLVEMDSHINDPSFAGKAVEILMNMLRKRPAGL